MLVAAGFFVASSANAQFGDLMRDLSKIAGEINKTQSVQKPAESKNNDVAEKKQVSLSSPISECEKGEDLIFSCNIKGKPLTYCYGEMGGVRYLNGKTERNGKEISFRATDLRDSGENPPYANYQENSSDIDGRDLFMTVYITESDNTTYALTQCGGMRCGILGEQPWFTVYKGSKKVSLEQCDAETVDGKGFNYKINKNLKVINDGLYREKKSKFKFESPEI